MEELKKCPFCGGEAKIISKNSVEDKYAVMCTDVRCIAFDIEPSYLEKNKAIKAWNTRKPMERIVERLENEKGTEVFAISVSGRNCGNSYRIGYETGIDEAIEIVKEEM